MNKLARNGKAAIAGAALAALLSIGMLHGCSYDANYLQINGGATATSAADTVLTIHAENSKGVYSYFMTETSAAVSPAAPAADDTGWQSIAGASTVYDGEIPHPLAAEGARTVYVWFKDGYGNVSDPVSDTINYTKMGGPAAPGYP